MAYFHSTSSALRRQGAFDVAMDEEISGVCILKQQFGRIWPGELNSGFNVAVNAYTGNIAVTDRHVAQVKVYNQDGDFEVSFNTGVGLDSELSSAGRRKKSYPKGIVINPVSQDIMVTDGFYVKAFDQSGGHECKHKFPAVSPNGKTSDVEDDSFLSGLALDTNSRLLVGEVRHRYISKHHLDGRHITTIRVRVQPQFLTSTPEGKIIVSPWGMNASIHVLDSTGKLLYELKPPSEISHLWFPSGLCFSEGTVFVSNVLGIYCFSVFGDYLGCATQEVSSPLGLAVTHDGEMLLAVDGTGSSVKVFSLKY